ncbi:hypothetical protein HZU83_20460 [Sphaerotilus montanus]|mgnify:CR=1 FL=1|jgi:cytochrome bd-type quinol oxidase subunit 2|uniref:Cytochrome bd-type quinol oxidase subunit 2 n=1 Tax=Sphaerotilus montanus TaxID=522889 RepID=A0A7Y9U758_9BURK|nr:hypothetical protein [Sphaerotilus montanus]NYG34783.1 cytochrome bd-type quinol oxidase subunit 2 [Sphaerotilus montanus]NZD59057.1 hypothetical protein [Sphaerotilus montanus]
MAHALLHLITTRPQLLVDHAQAYAELANADLDAVTSAWKRQLRLAAAALCGAAVATVLAGVALMLWAVIPAAQIEAPWALVAAPLLPALVALGCVLAARADSERQAFGNLKEQVQADLLMLRQVGAVS